MREIKRVILVGANGRLGPHILSALLEVPTFAVSVLTRESSKSEYPSHVNVVKVSDDLPYERLKNVFQGQDALVIAYSGTQTENSIKLANAAFEANLQHVIPADYGSCDSSDPRSLSLVPLYKKKKDVRDHLIDLSTRRRADGDYMTWTSLITGHFFDYGLKSGLLSMNIEARTATVFDGGDHKFAATTLAHIGRATTAVLQMCHHPRLRNKLVYVQSIQTTQNDLIRAVEKSRGQKIEATHVDSVQFVEKYKKKLDDDMGNAGFTEELVSVEGILNTDWDNKGDAFVNDLLGLPSSNLDEIVDAALK